MLLRLFMQRWQSKLASRRQFQNQQIVEFSKRHLKTAFRVWQAKLKQKQQLVWRSEMRKKLKIIKNKLDLNVKKDAWAKWRQLQLSRRADRQYRLFFLVHFFARWKTKLRQVSEMADVANEYASHLDLKVADRFWDYWKRAAISRHRELVVVQRVDWRIMVNAFDRWKQRG
jgi:protein SFI1